MNEVMKMVKMLKSRRFQGSETYSRMSCDQMSLHPSQILPAGRHPTFIQWLQKWTTPLKCGQSKTVFVLFMRDLWPRIWWESPSRWMGWSSYGRAVTGDLGWSCLAAVMFPRSGRRHWGPAGRETWQRRLRGPRTSGKAHTSVSRAGNTGGGNESGLTLRF